MVRNQGSNWVQSGLFDDRAAFLAAAHELKAPLSLIRQLSLALSARDSLSEVDVERLTEQITLTAERALRLTTDITRASRQAELFPMETINALQICEEVAQELTPLFSAHDMSISVGSYRNPPLLIGNRDLLKRVLLNFCDNALHYADTRGKIEIQVAARNFSQEVRIGVRDYGPAVAADTWKVLVERLKSASPQAVHARPGSSGLGLWTASQFAVMMNSRLGAKRHRDGASFFIEMPMSRQLSLLP